MGEKPNRRTTIVEVHAVEVHGRLRDRQDASRWRVGVFSTMVAAKGWVKHALSTNYFYGIGRDDSSDSFFCLELSELLLDKCPEVELRRVVLDATGRQHGVAQGPDDAPWPGRLPHHCGYKPGDFVAFVENHMYRIGMVSVQPPAPGALEGGTQDCDVYMVEVYESNVPSKHAYFAHSHVSEADLWPAPARINARLRKHLERRLTPERWQSLKQTSR